MDQNHANNIFKRSVRKNVFMKQGKNQSFAIGVKINRFNNEIHIDLLTLKQTSTFVLAWKFHTKKSKKKITVMF